MILIRPVSLAAVLCGSLLWVSLLLGCSATPSDGNTDPLPSTGGSNAANQAGASAGGSLPALGSAGTGADSAGSSNVGGNSTAGNAGSSTAGGGSSSGGAGGSGGNSNVAGGGAGGNVSGAGGDSGSGGGDGKKSVLPSTGCGTANPPSGELQTADTVVNFIVSLPADYDPEKAYPLGFGFHGGNRTHEECQQGDCVGFQEVMENDAILIYEKAVGGSWGDVDAPYFIEMLETMKSGYCVDENRVFVAGTSSGAGHSNRIACLYGDQILATAPVAGWMPTTDCVGQPAAIVIHGINDLGNDISGGYEARDFYIEQNGCSDTSVPPDDEMDARVLAQREAMTEEGHECADYQGCPVGMPVRWCVHSYGGYDNINHGWPPIGGQIIWDFVQTL